MTEIAKKPIKITETILRDAHQSLIATRRIVSVICTGFISDIIVPPIITAPKVRCLIVQARTPSDFLSPASLNSKNCHKGSGCYGRTDNSGYVRSHGMHQQEVGRICFRSYLL